MPMKTAKSGLIAKLGAAGRAAHEKHKNDETDFGSFNDLPEGIDGGVARLVECKFDTYKKGDLTGQYFFYAAGVILHPKEFRGESLEGRRTSITEPLCPSPNRTRKTVEEHLEWVYNELRKLGVNTAEMGFEDLEVTAAALKAEQPTFRFRTWKGEKQTTGPYKDMEPRVQQSWTGKCEWTGEAEPGEGVADSSPSANGEASAEAGEAGEAAAGGGEGFDEFGDIDSVVAKAKEDDPEAQIQLTKMAVDAGATEDQVNAAKKWDEVAELIRAGAGGAGGEAAAGEAGEAGEAEAEWAPEKGQVYGYKVRDPRTGNPLKDPKSKKEHKPIDVEVTSVNEANKTVTLKNNVTKKSITGADPKRLLQVPWDHLESASE
jgi:hypothetical protein